MQFFFFLTRAQLQRNFSLLYRKQQPRGLTGGKCYWVSMVADSRSEWRLRRPERFTPHGRGGCVSTPTVPGGQGGVAWGWPSHPWLPRAVLDPAGISSPALVITPLPPVTWPSQILLVHYLLAAQSPEPPTTEHLPWLCHPPAPPTQHSSFHSRSRAWSVHCPFPTALQSTCL